ncbi:MAG: hydrogenase formation protein HypD [Thermoplasmata archaeon]|nr:MAG: hydrogenase formation protein HypD [Aciduliprofundum sp.]
MNTFRDREIASGIIRWLRERSLNIRIMHVCGTHQDTLVRNGLDEIFFSMGIDIREGPGCPVCVTTTREIEYARLLARKGKTVAVFGDMLRAPGERGSLETEKSRGADVIVVYSIEDALNHARSHPEKEVVFLGVGFETTMPSTAVTLMKNPPDNFHVLSMHRLTPPAVKGIAELGNVMLDGIILPGHVSAIIGSIPWEFISENYGIPQVVAGFEPLDLLMGAYMIVRQMEEGRSIVEIEYTRVVKREGNLRAKRLMDEVFMPVDMEWRGFPVLEKSGMKIREKYSMYDAELVYEDILSELKEREFRDPPGCRCGELIRGEIYPWDCPLFGKVCRPENPVGPCMVSTEGACAIEYKYGKLKKIKEVRRYA